MNLPLAGGSETDSITLPLAGGSGFKPGEGLSPAFDHRRHIQSRRGVVPAQSLNPPFR